MAPGHVVDVKSLHVQEEAAAAASKSAAAAALRLQKKSAAYVALPGAGAHAAPIEECQEAADQSHENSNRQRPAQHDVGADPDDTPAPPEQQQSAEGNSLAGAATDAAATGPVQVDINVNPYQEGGDEAAEAAVSRGIRTEVSVTFQICQR